MRNFIFSYKHIYPQKRNPEFTKKCQKTFLIFCAHAETYGYKTSRRRNTAVTFFADSLFISFPTRKKTWVLCTIPSRRGGAHMMMRQRTPIFSIYVTINRFTRTPFLRPTEYVLYKIIKYTHRYVFIKFKKGRNCK